MWLKTEKQKQDLKKGSKDELGEIKKRFEDNITKVQTEVKRRDRKEKDKKKKKKLAPGESRFEEDAEKGKDREERS